MICSPLHAAYCLLSADWSEKKSSSKKYSMICAAVVFWKSTTPSTFPVGRLSFLFLTCHEWLGDELPLVEETVGQSSSSSVSSNTSFPSVIRRLQLTLPMSPPKFSSPGSLPLSLFTAGGLTKTCPGARSPSSTSSSKSTSFPSLEVPAKERHCKSLKKSLLQPDPHN